MPFYVDFFAQSVKKAVSHAVKRLFPILSLIFCLSAKRSFVFQRSDLLSFSVAVFCLLQYFNNYTAVVLTTFFGVVGVDRFCFTTTFGFEAFRINTAFNHLLHY